MPSVPIWVAIVTAVAGYVATLVNARSAERKGDADSAARLRDELWKQVTVQQGQIAALTERVEELQLDRHANLAKIASLQVVVETLTQRLTDATSEIESLTGELDALRVHAAERNT